MGINITAIIPVEDYKDKLEHIIHKLENNGYQSIENHKQALYRNDFSEDRYKPQWYLNDKMVDKHPPLPNHKPGTGIELPSGLVIRFFPKGIGIWSWVRAFLAMDIYPEVGESLLKVYQEIGQDLNAEYCLVMGDHNPVYHSFLKNEPYLELLDPKRQKSSLKDVHVDVYIEDFGESYDIKGYHLLKIKKDHSS